MRRISKYITIFIIFIFSIIISTLIINAVLSGDITIGYKTLGGTDSWIQYYGSIIGSLIGGGVAGIVAYYIAKIQVNDQKENSKIERKEQIKKEIQVITSDQLSELAHRLYKSLNEKQNRVRNLLEIYYSRDVLDLDLVKLYGDSLDAFLHETEETLGIHIQISALLYSKRLVLSKFHNGIMEVLIKVATINQANVDMGAKLHAIHNALKMNIDIGENLNKTVEFFNNEYLVNSEILFKFINKVCLDIQKDFIGELFEEEMKSMIEMSPYFNSQKFVLKKLHLS